MNLERNSYTLLQYTFILLSLAMKIHETFTRKVIVASVASGTKMFQDAF